MARCQVNFDTAACQVRFLMGVSVCESELGKAEMSLTSALSTLICSINISLATINTIIIIVIIFNTIIVIIKMCSKSSFVLDTHFLIV